MKRFFINQSGLSNKFWNIEIEEKTQKITFGKINTLGRQTTKTFNTSEECERESGKIISGKIKKGYVEIRAEEVISEKTPVSDQEAGEIFFWHSISKSNKNRKSNWSEYDIDKHLESLTELLSKSGKPTLIQFEKCLQENLQKLYKAEIAELSIILECDFKVENGQVIYDDYLSEDGFIYFRCWLLLQGKEFFNDITKDINAFISGKYSLNIGDTWAEGLLYVADEAYSTNHDNEDDSEIRDAVSKLFPEVIHYDSAERQMDRQSKGGEELQKMYPKLVKTISEIKK